ncbi:MAG: circadian clock protein KaiC [Firmicutes bacterium]|nr:circadian clock protein KaiC [Bacillota bacterium]
MDKLKTGIKNLDGILNGGIPVYSLNIVSGSPGSGKTIFVQNIIFNSARSGLKSLYLTTISESQFKMVRHLQEFEFFSDDFLGDKFIYGDLGDVLRKQGTDKVLGYLTEMIKRHQPNIVVIDSFKAIRDIFPDEKTFKAFVFDLAAALSIWEVTVFLIGEYEEKELTLLSEFAIADGIFHLYGQEEKRFQKRYLRILKMRGTNFEQGEHLFQISSAGIEVYPRIKPEGKKLQYEVRSRRKGFGITGLDEMLSGGITEGTITLISGGTGTGKTVFALKFLLDGAEKGEKGLFLSFEEPVTQLIDNARCLGWELDRYLADGRLNIKFISPIELDVDKHAFEILDMVNKNKVERFVIDSISSFESSVSDIQKYKDYLWAIGQQLKRRHITTIFTVLNEDLFSPVVVTKAQISLMTDNIIILRYVEDNSSVKKVLGILKTRGINHDRDIREYEITPNGINVLGKLDKANMLR